MIRQFCTPVFWTSEEVNKDLIKERTREAVFRTIYWLNKKSKPKTLKNYVEQEVFVAKSVYSKSLKPSCDVAKLKKYYTQNADSEEYTLIFNFFYGDTACESLGFPTFDIEEPNAGFKFVRYL